MSAGCCFKDKRIPAHESCFFYPPGPGCYQLLNCKPMPLEPDKEKNHTVPQPNDLKFITLANHREELGLARHRGFRLILKRKKKKKKIWNKRPLCTFLVCRINSNQNTREGKACTTLCTQTPIILINDENATGGVCLPETHKAASQCDAA